MTIHRIVIDLDGVHKQGLCTEDPDLAERWARDAIQNGKASGHQLTPVAVHFEPADGIDGRSIVRAVHRLHADIVRNADGSIEVRNLYHYPEREAGDNPQSPADMAPQNPLLTKRQWAKIPQVASKRHWIIEPEKKP